jgi:hypothetical protein
MHYIARLLTHVKQKQKKVFGIPEKQSQQAVWLLLLYSEQTREYNINKKIWRL